MARPKRSLAMEKKRSQPKRRGGIAKGTKLGPNTWTRYIGGACSSGYQSRKKVTAARKSTLRSHKKKSRK